MSNYGTGISSNLLQSTMPFTISLAIGIWKLNIVNILEFFSENDEIAKCFIENSNNTIFVEPRN